MKRNHVAVLAAAIAGAGLGAFLSTAGAQVGQTISAAPVVPVGVSGGGNFAWFLSGRIVWSCTAGAGSMSPPVCTKGMLPQ